MIKQTNYSSEKNAQSSAVPFVLTVITEPQVLGQTGQTGWLGVAKVSGILCHRSIQLKLASSWARPAILVAGKGRGGML